MSSYDSLWDSKEEKSRWWWDDYNYDYRDYSYRKGSGSRSWMSKIGYADDWWNKAGSNENETFQELLNQLQNSANLIGSEESGKIVVNWSNGQSVNEFDNSNGVSTIYLSPDNLLSSGVVSEENLDAMTGKVYLASTLRETVDKESYDKAKIARSALRAKDFAQDDCQCCGSGKKYYDCCGRNDPCPCGSGKKASQCCLKNLKETNIETAKNALVMWEAMETSIARSKIMSDWAGFGPYVASDAQKSSATKEEVQNFIDSRTALGPSTEVASLAIAWNLLNSSDPVSIPDFYDECIEAAGEMMEQEIEPKDRFKTCSDLANKIAEIIKEEKSKSDSEGEDKDGKSGSSKKSGMPKDGMPMPKDGMPKVCDDSLLGEVVKNETDATLNAQSGESSVKNSDDPGNLGDIRVPPPPGLSDVGKRCDIVDVEVTDTEENKYKEIVSKYRTQINSIRSSLYFRNNHLDMVSYGHRSGDIDDNSLFKIRLNDDRLMTKTDVANAKRIAVCLLVDESGSMEEGSRYAHARNVAIILGESIKGLTGINVNIYGHSAEEGKYPGVTIREYYSPKKNNIAACMKIRPRVENHDSYAILHAANMFNKDYHDYDRKIIFVISDGEPAGHGYYGDPAMKHMLDVSKACERRGIEVYGIGVDQAYNDIAGKKMYGNNRFVVLDDVDSSLGVMARFIRQVAMK